MRLYFLNDVSHFVCDGFHNIGTHQITAIGKTGISLDQLHGRDLYFITNGHPGLGNTAPFIRALEPSTFISRKIDLSRCAKTHISGTPTQIDLDRKSTRLNSSHVAISYAVFCLKNKKYNSAYYKLYYICVITR